MCILPAPMSPSRTAQVLLTNTWTNATSPSGQLEFRAAAGGGQQGRGQGQGQQLVMTPTDMAVRWDPELLAIAQVGGRLPGWGHGGLGVTGRDCSAGAGRHASSM